MIRKRGKYTMQTTNYKGYVVTLSDMDTNKLEKAGGRGAARHWRCIVYDKTKRKQMGFDTFGGSAATMSPLEALYMICEDACTFMQIDDVDDVMNEYGYSDYTAAKNVFKGLQKAYYQCRRFIGSDDDICEIANDLREEWG